MEWRSHEIECSPRRRAHLEGLDCGSFDVSRDMLLARTRHGGGFVCLPRWIRRISHGVWRARFLDGPG